MYQSSDNTKHIIITLIVMLSILTFTGLFVGARIHLESQRISRFSSDLIEAKECKSALSYSSSDNPGYNEKVLKCYEGVMK